MGKFSDYKLFLKSLPEGIHESRFHLGKQFFVDMESTDIRDADLNADLVLNHHNGIYELDFHITGEVTVLCDRCLDDLHFPIDTTYHIVVKYGDRYNDDSDDLLEIPESNNYLNVAYMLFDTASLAIPIKHVHPMGKCNRAMSALLKKHRAEENDDFDDMDLDGDDMDFDGNDMGTPDDNNAPAPEPEKKTDPRWDKLRDLKTDSNKDSK